MMPLFDVPNLDGLSVDPKDYAEATAVFASLMTYTANKKEAMEHRSRGDIKHAKEFEAVCERIYQSLPNWAKW